MKSFNAILCQFKIFDTLTSNLNLVTLPLTFNLLTYKIRSRILYNNYSRYTESLSSVLQTSGMAADFTFEPFC